MKKQTTKIVTVLIALFLMGVPSAMATSGSASSPVQYQVNYILGVDTAFTVTPAGAETSMDFNPATKNSQQVEPDSQVKGSSTPWAIITNDGNVNQDFSVNLTSAQASQASVNISNTNVFTQMVLLSQTAQSPTGWTTVAPAASVDLYALANFTNLPGGTTSKTLKINSVQS